MTSSALAQAFPSALPEGWRYTPGDVGLRLILDGRLVHWDGPAQEIRSAVCVRDKNGALSQLGLGKAAVASAAEACAHPYGANISESTLSA